MDATVASLHVYPVKSCRGIALETSQIGDRGLAFDREWMIVDGEGTFMTQRELPRLAFVAPALTSVALEIQTAGMPRLIVPLDLDLDAAKQPVRVWRDSFPAFDQGDEAASWLSSALRTPLRLVRFDPGFQRDCNTTYVGDSGAHTRFADAFPLLILSEASLDDLNARLAQPLPMNRFRPNIVLSGIGAYDEDHIAEIRLGSIALKLVKRCTRCQITTTDQATAVVGTEPLATLAGYRMNEALQGVTFGMNAIVTAGGGHAIHRGDRASCALDF